MTEYENVYRRDVRIPLTEGLPEIVVEHGREFEGPGGDYLFKGPMKQVYEFIHPETGKVLCDTDRGNMPLWWQAPNAVTRAKLVARCKTEKGVLPTTNNVVTLIVRADNSGRFVMQLRGYGTSESEIVNNAGKLELPRTLMRDGESAFQALARGTEVGLGVEIIGGDVRKLFDHYDPEMGRVNEVYALLQSYRSMLILLERSCEPAIDALMNPSGIGRVFIDEDNLKQALGVAGAVTEVTRDILMRYLFKL